MSSSSLLALSPESCHSHSPFVCRPLGGTRQKFYLANVRTRTGVLRATFLSIQGLQQAAMNLYAKYFDSFA